MNAKKIMFQCTFVAALLIITFSANTLRAESLNFGRKISYFDYNPSAEFLPTFPVYLGIMADTKDCFLSGGFGIMVVPEYFISIQVTGYYRLFDKTVFVEKKSNWLYQFKEERYGIALTADIPFYISDTEFAVFAGGGVGYTAANYKGTSHQAESKGTPVGKFGLQYGKRFYGRIGYQYMKIPHVPSNWGIFELGFIF